MAFFRIAVCGRKGGVGKTTTATALASYLAFHDLNVLVVDLDPQSNTGFVLGVDPVAPGSAELILGQSPQPLQATHNLYVLPGGQGLQSRDVERAEPEELAFALKGFKEFDIIIFDCPPGTDYLERLGLVAANVALICTNAHPLGIIGAERVLHDIYRRQERDRPGPKHSAFVLTQINNTRKFDRELPHQLQQKYPDMPQLLIRQNTDLAWSTALRTPFMVNSPNPKSIHDIERIARWTMQNTLTQTLVAAE
jgi:chromosome partitioning protein